MITREPNEVARELSNILIEKIYRICKERQEEEIELEFTLLNTRFLALEVDFPCDDEELTDEEYLDEMSINVVSEYFDEDDAQLYTDNDNLNELEVGTLLAIYNAIKK